jgi:broad specificity phosphatase PhoE
MKVALIPCAASEWREKGRLLGRVELSPAPGSSGRYAEWVEPLRAIGLTRVFHSPDELSTRAAESIARRLDVPAKPLDELLEVDVGLWAGLTEQQLKQRFARAHRQLCESPLNVHPPGGESFSDAARRVHACLSKRIKRNGRANLGIVMRPLSLAMARCLLEQGEIGRVWETAQSPDEPVIVECAGPSNTKEN